MDIEKAKSLVMEILKKGSFQVDSLTVEEKGPGEFFINIVTRTDAVLMIGKRGDVLISLQHVIKNVLRSQGILSEAEHLKVDVDSYRLNQEKNVLALADRMAKEVLETGRQGVMPPMSSFFRRLVHIHVKENFPDLTTFSQGSENFRSVTITSANATPDDDSPGDIYSDIEA